MHSAQVAEILNETRIVYLSGTKGSLPDEGTPHSWLKPLKRGVRSGSVALKPVYFLTFDEWEITSRLAFCFGPEGTTLVNIQNHMLLELLLLMTS